MGGGAWPPGFPSRPNLGLCFPWPCLLSFTPSLLVTPHPFPGRLGASGEGGGALRRCPGCCLAGETALSCISVCLQVVIWGSSSGRGSGLLLLAPSAVSVSLSLSHSRGPLSLSPSSVCLYMALSACPHLSLSGWGWDPSSICGSLSIPDFRFPASGGGGARLSPPSTPPSASQSYLTPGSPSPICLSPVSGSQNLRFPRTLGLQPRQAPSPWGT